MLKSMLKGLGALVLGLCVSSAAAYCPPDHEGEAKAGEKQGGCAHKGEVTAGAPDSGCPYAKMAAEKGGKVDAVLASLPQVKYRVGDKDVCCPRAAKAMLTSGAQMKYVVGEEAFDSEDAANAKLAVLLEQRLADMQSMQYSAGGDCGRCPMHAKEVAQKTNTTVTYRVGGVDFADKEKAEAAVKLVSEAAAGVAMACKVDGKAVDCGATPSCGSGETKTTYVVGDQETQSKDTAKLLTLQAKIRKVVETAVAQSA